MELEFKNLANVKAEPSRFVSANLQVVSMNIAKNDDDGDDGDQTWNLNVLDKWDSRNFQFYPKKSVCVKIFGKNALLIYFDQIGSLFANLY